MLPFTFSLALEEKKKQQEKIPLYVITYCNTSLGPTEYFQYSEIIDVMSFDNGCTEIVQSEIRVLF